MKSYENLLEYINKRGNKRQKEQTDETLLADAQSLTGDAKTLVLWLLNAHPDIPKGELNYPFYEGNMRYTRVSDVIKSIPEGSTFWTTSNYNTLWDAFFPKHWEVLVKNAWEQIPLNDKLNTLYGLATEWRLKELDIYEFLDFNTALQGKTTFPIVPIATQALNNGDEKLATQIKNILQNEGEIGEISPDIILISLKCTQSDLWDAVNKLLLAAQRQEGLRQAIVNSIRLASLGAKIVLLQTILDNELCRFASVLTAMKQYILYCNWQFVF
jgi:hypothetical protein